MKWVVFAACTLDAGLAALNAAAYATAHQAANLAASVFCGLILLVTLAIWARR